MTPGARMRAVVIDVVQEQVERAHALLEAALDLAPLVGGDDARHQVERHDLLDAFGALIDGEGDPARLEREIGGALAPLDFGSAQRRQLAGQRRVVVAHLPGASNISSQNPPGSYANGLGRSG